LYDKRIYRFDPIKGSFLGIKLESYRGELAYKRYFGEMSFYFPFKILVFCLHGEFGYATSATKSLILPYFAFFKADKFSELKPSDFLSGCVGSRFEGRGDKYFLGTLEARIPVFERANLSFKTKVFLDAWNYWSGTFENLYLGLGGGFYITIKESRLLLDIKHFVDLFNAGSTRKTAFYLMLYWPLYYPSTGLKDFYFGR
jgi:outer membrane protein assembly factor BamA